MKIVTLEKVLIGLDNMEFSEINSVNKYMNLFWKEVTPRLKTELKETKDKFVFINECKNLVQNGWCVNFFWEGNCLDLNKDFDINILQNEIGEIKAIKYIGQYLVEISYLQNMVTFYDNDVGIAQVKFTNENDTYLLSFRSDALPRITYPALNLFINDTINCLKHATSHYIKQTQQTLASLHGKYETAKMGIISALNPMLVLDWKIDTIQLQEKRAVVSLYKTDKNNPWHRTYLIKNINLDDFENECNIFLQQIKDFEKAQNMLECLSKDLTIKHI